MVKTIRVSEGFHGWIAANNDGVETMEATLRRLILDRGVAGRVVQLPDADAERATAAVDALRAGDAVRLEAVREFA